MVCNCTASGELIGAAAINALRCLAAILRIRYSLPFLISIQMLTREMLMRFNVVAEYQR